MRNTALSAVIGLSLGALPASALAQADPAAVSEPSEGLGEIIVTAQRRAERLRDVPFTVTSQSESDLISAGVASTKDLALTVPGLAFTTQGAFALPNLRGVSASFSGVGAESSIALYVDGVYYVNQVGSVFDLPDVKRVEVLKGPQGTLFGRNATGGAILITTKDPEFEFGGRATVQQAWYTGANVRDAGEFRASAFVTGPVSDTIAVSVSGSYTHTDGFLTNDVTGGRVGRREAMMLRGKVLFQPHDGARFVLSGFYGRDDDDAASSMQPLNGVTAVNGTRTVNGQIVPAWTDGIVPTKSWHIAGEMDGSHVRVRSSGVSLTGSVDLPELGTLSTLTSYLYVDAVPTVDVDAAYSPSCLAAFSCINFNVGSGPNRSLQQEVTFTSEQFGAFRFIAGAFYYYDKGRQSQNVNFPFGDNGRYDYSDTKIPGGVFGSGVIATEAIAGFGEATFDIADNFHLTGGIRYGHERKVSNSSLRNGPNVRIDAQWSSWTPRLSLRYDISANANVYATFSKGFKSGIIPVNGGTFVTEPESLNSYEIGSKIGTRGFSLAVAAFYYDYKDLQVQFFDGVTVSLANAANARIIGLEADGTVEIVPGVRFRLGGSYVPKAEYREFTGGVDTDFWAPSNFYPFGTLNGAGGAIGPGGLRQVVGIDASGLRLLKTPKLTGTASLDIERETSIGRINGNVTLYHSSRYNWNLNGRVRTDGYNLLNARFAVTPRDSNLTIAIFGKNLTNEAYISSAVLSSSADAVSYGAPRQIGASLELNF